MIIITNRSFYPIFMTTLRERAQASNSKFAADRSCPGRQLAVALADATWIAAIKGVAAGSANLALALWLGATWPPLPELAAALSIGSLAYGASLALFVIGLRHLGTARTGAYFSVARRMPQRTPVRPRPC